MVLRHVGCDWMMPSQRHLSAQLVILGAGPAGCMAAIGALRKDPTISVLLVDRERTGLRHRIGEALLTGTLYAIEEAGLTGVIAEQGYHLKRGAAYVWGKDRKPWYVNYPSVSDYPKAFTSPDTEERFSVHVPRHHFDAILHREAVRLGAQPVIGRVTDVVLCGNRDSPSISRVILDNERSVFASYWIDATGQNAILGRRLSLRQRIGSPRVARYAYFRDVQWETAERHGFDMHRTNIVSSRNGWFWVIHLGTVGLGLTSIGFVTTPDIAMKLRFDNAVEFFPELAWFGYRSGLAQIKDVFGGPMQNWYVHPDYSFRQSRIDGSNWALAGDAAMFIDPILSQGVTLACHYGLKRGQAAVSVLAEDHSAQTAVSAHYLAEGGILQDICGTWYGNNVSAGDWKLQSAVVSERCHGQKMGPDDAFRWVTNLENVRQQYNAYPSVVQQDINRHLGLA
jgi:flavin-dependent dehydrogenase